MSIPFFQEVFLETFIDIRMVEEALEMLKAPHPSSQHCHVKKVFIPRSNAL